MNPTTNNSTTQQDLQTRAQIIARHIVNSDNREHIQACITFSMMYKPDTQAMRNFYAVMAAIRTQFDSIHTTKEDQDAFEDYIALEVRLLAEAPAVTK